MFDPKKLRESMKLNLSTEVFFTLTSSLKEKRNRKPPDLVTVPSSTVATVLRQGRRQSDTVSPANKSSELKTVVSQDLDTVNSPNHHRIIKRSPFSRHEIPKCVVSFVYNSSPR